ncbi:MULTISPECIES: YdcF family protein [unclassified Sinorhizobium]|uniref:YdcF family protein n=1 Tax=unclassified Sinorhizobium TaxID=2613772 RepID=UPI0035248406
MFLFSKLVWIIGQPLSLAFILVILAIIAIIVRWRVLGLLASSASALVLFLTLYTTVGPYLLQDLEERFPRPAGDPPELQCMIVLGGAFETEVTTTRGGIEMSAGGDRFVEALRLARKFPDARILVSGGDGSITGGYEGDGDIAKRFFPIFGIGRERLVEEAQSRTTFENAVNTKELLARNGLSNCLLITSGYHMPRSIGIFRKLDIPVTPWPTDYRTTGKVRLGLDFTQPSLNAQHMATAIREWMGLVGYYFAGRTSELYPR